MCNVGLTTSLTISDAALPHVSCAPLRHCNRFLSPYFNGRSVLVISHNNGTLVTDPNPQIPNSYLAVRMFLGALKIVAWMTVILPLLAFIGALIFKANNTFLPADHAFFKNAVELDDLKKKMSAITEAENKNAQVTQAVQQHLSDPEVQEDFRAVEAARRKLQEHEERSGSASAGTGVAPAAPTQLDTVRNELATLQAAYKKLESQAATASEHAAENAKLKSDIEIYSKIVDQANTLSSETLKANQESSRAQSEQNKRLNERCEKALQDLTKAENERADLSRHKKDLERTVTYLESQLAQSETSRQERNQQLSQQNQRLQDQYNKAQLDLVTAQGVNNQLGIEKNGAEARAKALTARIDNLQSQIAKKATDDAALTQFSQSSDYRVRQLQSENDALQAERKKWQDQIATLETERKHLQGQIVGLQTDVSNKDQRFQEDQVAYLQQETLHRSIHEKDVASNRKLKEENDQLKEGINRLQSELRGTENGYAALGSRNSELKERNEQLEAENAALQKRVSSAAAPAMQSAAKAAAGKDQASQFPENDVIFSDSDLIELDYVAMVRESEQKSPADNGNLARYIAVHHAHVDPTVIDSLIQRGRDLFRIVLNDSSGKDTEALQKRDDKYLQECVAGMVWKLMEYALKTGKEFSEGSFIFDDENHRVYQFIEKMRISYQRISSHLTHVAPRLQPGIDVTEYPLPAGKGHVFLIPLVDNSGRKMTFLKIENHGTRGAGALVGHGFEYIVSLGRRFFPVLFGGNEGEGMRKERIPEAERKEFTALIRDLSEAERKQLNTDQVIREVGSGGNGQGIQRMYRFLNEAINDANVTTISKVKLQQFREKLEKNYDRVGDRFGNEVLANAEALCS